MGCIWPGDLEDHRDVVRTGLIADAEKTESGWAEVMREATPEEVKDSRLEGWTAFALSGLRDGVTLSSIGTDT